MTISKDRMTKYMYKVGDLEPLGLVIPNKLKEVVSNAPLDDKAVARYLRELVKSNAITTDDVTFLVDSGALQN